jgi:hypothetical protein
MFRTVPLSIIRNLFTVHSAMVYVIQALYTQLSSRSRMELVKTRWTEELSETCRVSWQNIFVKLVHLFDFITKKFVTIQHGHMNVKQKRDFDSIWAVIEVLGIWGFYCIELFHHRLLDRDSMFSVYICQNTRGQVIEDDSLNYDGYLVGL